MLGSSGRLSLNLSMWRTIASLISPPSHHQPTVSLLVKRMTELSTSGLQDVYFQIFGTSILQGDPKNVHTRLFNFILFLSVIFIGHWQWRSFYLRQNSTQNVCIKLPKTRSLQIHWWPLPKFSNTLSIVRFA